VFRTDLSRNTPGLNTHRSIHLQARTRVAAALGLASALLLLFGPAAGNAKSQASSSRVATQGTGNDSQKTLTAADTAAPGTATPDTAEPIAATSTALASMPTSISTSTTITSTTNMLPVAGLGAVEVGGTRQTSTVMVPAGLTATGIRGQIRFPYREEPVTVVISVAGSRVAVVSSADVGFDGIGNIDVELPASVRSSQAADESMKTDTTTTVDFERPYVVSVEALTASTRPGSCLEKVISRVELVNFAVLTTGVPQPPKTMSQFLSAHMTSIQIVSPTSATDTAAVQFAAAATSRSREVRVSVTRSVSPLVAVGTSSRLVVLQTDSGKPSMSVSSFRASAPTTTSSSTSTPTNLDYSVPELLVRGTQEQMITAARSLATAQVGVATATSVGRASSTEQNYGHRQLILGQLDRELTSASGGLNGISLDQGGSRRWSASVPQALFGGPIGSVTLHLRGRYSVLPTGLIGEVRVLWNDTLVSSTAFGKGSDQFQTKVEIPRDIISRENTLTIETRLVNSVGNCAPDPTVRVDLDPGSSLAITDGQTLPPGFTRFPQVLRGTFLYSVDPASKDRLAATQSAAAVVSALARLSPDPLLVENISLARLRRSSRSGVVVGATPRTALELGAPFQFADGRSISNGDGIVSFDVNGAAGALQAFRADAADIVLVAGTDDAMSWRAARALAAHKDGWYRLSDEIQLLDTITNPGTDVLVGIPRDRYAPAMPDEFALAPGTPHRRWTWVHYCLLTLAATATLRLLVEFFRIGRLRRKARRVALQTANGTYPEVDRRRHVDRRSQEAAPIRGDRRGGGGRRAEEHDAPGGRDPVECNLDVDNGELDDSDIDDRELDLFDDDGNVELVSVTESDTTHSS
jgi:hypothetical protein